MKINEKLQALREHPHSVVTEISENVYFLNQSYTTHCGNYLQVQKQKGELEYLIDCSPEKQEEREIQRRETISAIHNYLSSYYSLKESVEKSFKAITTERGNLAATNSDLYQRFEDDTAFMLAMRTCVQHRKPLDLDWIAKYSHSESVYEYQIGFWLSDLIESDISWGDTTDANGNHQEGIEYHFGDIQGPFVDFFEQAHQNINRTQRFYRESAQRIINYAEEEIEAFDLRSVEKLEDIAFDLQDKFDRI